MTSKVISVNMRPEILAALKRAIRLYSGIAYGEYRVYYQPGYKFYDIDHAIMQDTSDELLELVKDIEFCLLRSSSDDSSVS